MSPVVLGVGASHTTLMNTQWDAVDHLDRAHRFRDGLAEARRTLAASRPDLVVVVGTNHFRGLWLDLMPAFTIGVDELVAVGEHGTPAGAQAVDPPAALAVCEGLIDRGFDPAFSARLQVDHGISHAIQYLVPEATPVLAVVVNAFAPPLPGLARCLAFGAALREALADLGDRRVAVVGTGGLSHQIPFPDWRDPQGDDERFLAESFRTGRDRWEEFEARRRPIVVGARPQLNVEFDRTFLDLLEHGRLATLPELHTDDALVQVAGNGANEVRTWLIAAAALDHAPGRTIAYAPMPEWLTGMAVAVIDPATP